ncbi:MAG TPA: hypothetical protein VF037_01190 [Gemmatimonadales bacterium]
MPTDNLDGGARSRGRRPASLLLGAAALLAACSTTEPEPDPPAATTVLWFGCYLSGGGGGICRVFPDGSGFTLVESADASGALKSIAASPDGRQVAFTCPGVTAEAVCIMDSDGENRRRILEDAEAIMPAWSPDASRIAFSRNWRIWTANVDGTGAVQLTPDSLLLIDPAWSPDGTKIIAAEPGPGDDLWMIDATGGNLVRFSDFERAPATPSWSPDGTRILYTGSSNQGADLFIMDLAGSPHVQVRTLGGIGEGDWSPDGTEVVVEKFDGVQMQLYRRTLVNEHLEPITRQLPLHQLHSPDWAVRAGF